MNTQKTLAKITKGFTLIELLVVIAVIGVLAGAIIVAINPTEQLARAADAGRKSSAQQLADAINGYYATNQGMPNTAAFITTVVNSGDLKVVPAAAGTSAGTTCFTSGVSTSQNGYCYTVVGTGSAQSNFVVYVMMQSTAEKSKCTGSGVSAFYAYSSADAKAGSVCGSAGGVGPTVTAGLTFN